MVPGLLGDFVADRPWVLTEVMAAGGDEAQRAFAAMMEMGKIHVAKIETAVCG